MTRSGQGHNVKAEDHTFIDERTVNLETGRTKAEKTDYVAIKQKLQQGLDKSKNTERLKIQFLRPGAGEKINVVIQEKEEAEKARRFTG